METEVVYEDVVGFFSLPGYSACQVNLKLAISVNG